MKTFRNIIIFALLNCAAATPALATGGFSCEFEDKNLSFTAASALGSGMGAPIFNLTAESNIKLKGVPADLVKLDLSKSLVHSWVESPDFRLYFYSEREGEKPHGYVELVIQAKYVSEDGDVKGNYRLTVFYTELPADKTEGTYIKAKGKVLCSVE